MRSVYFTLLLVLFSKMGLCQSSKWVTASNWRLYNTFSRNIDVLTADSLQNFPSARLNSDTIDWFLNMATLVPKEKTIAVIWMSWYWVSYELKHSTCILKISNYGGFILDENSGIYYEIPIADRKDWLAYFSHQAIFLLGPKQPEK